MIVQPSVTIIREQDPLKRIELAGRLCYKSEDKITESSAAPFVKRLIERGHMAPLEHARVVFHADNVMPRHLERALGPEPYGFRDRIGHPEGDMDTVYANIRDLLAAGYDLEDLAKLPMAPDYMTVHFVCDRAIANELVRHRVFSFMQLSTRFVCYKGEIEFVLPVPFDKYETGEETLWCWRRSCERAEASYHELLSLGSSPQEARNVLPLSLKTELIMTGTYSNWTDMLKLRMDEAAHPQMRYLMQLMVNNSQFPKDKIKLPKKENGDG